MAPVAGASLQARMQQVRCGETATAATAAASATVCVGTASPASVPVAATHIGANECSGLLKSVIRRLRPVELLFGWPHPLSTGACCSRIVHSSPQQPIEQHVTPAQQLHTPTPNVVSSPAPPACLSDGEQPAGATPRAGGPGARPAAADRQRGAAAAATTPTPAGGGAGCCAPTAAAAAGRTMQQVSSS